MSAAEGRQKIIQRPVVGPIDGGEGEAPFVAFSVEKIVVAHGQIKEMAGTTRGGLLSSFSFPGQAK
jgi:hypothetical protein